MKVVRANTDRMVKATVPGPFTMAVQAQDDYYKDEEAVANAYADVVNAGDQGSVRRRRRRRAARRAVDGVVPDKARKYGIKALNRAIDGVNGKIAVHLCLGYAHVVKNKPSRYEFFEELEASKADQISIETAEPKLDLVGAEEHSDQDRYSRRHQSRRS